MGIKISELTRVNNLTGSSMIVVTQDLGGGNYTSSNALLSQVLTYVQTSASFSSASYARSSSLAAVSLTSTTATNLGQTAYNISVTYSSASRWSTSSSYASASTTAGTATSATTATNLGLTAYNISVTYASSSRWSVSSSYASSSFNAISASYAPGSPSISASYATTALSASYAPGSPSISASYAVSASYALNGAGGGGMTLTTGSTYPITSSWADNVLTSSYISGSISIQGTSGYYPKFYESSLTTTSSIFEDSNGITLSVPLRATSSHALTASYAAGSSFNVPTASVINSIVTWGDTNANTLKNNPAWIDNSGNITASSIVLTNNGPSVTYNLEVSNSLGLDYVTTNRLLYVDNNSKVTNVPTWTDGYYLKVNSAATGGIEAISPPATTNRKNYLTFHRVDGVQGNAFRTGTGNLGDCLLLFASSSAATCYGTYNTIVPMDINISQSLTLESLMLVMYSAPDTGSCRFIISHGISGIGEPNDPTYTGSITIDVDGIASPAYGDVNYIQNVQLTNWNNHLVDQAGKYWEIKLARDGLTAQDTSRNPMWVSSFIISYISNQ